MTHPVTRARVRIWVKMETKNETNENATDTSQSFVVRMWQETPGEWRGTIRHVQTQSHLGFTQIEQAARFIGQYTRSVGKLIPAQTGASRPSWQFNFKLNRRTTRLVALAAALVLLTAVGMLAMSHGSVPQMLGFGH